LNAIKTRIASGLVAAFVGFASIAPVAVVAVLPTPAHADVANDLQKVVKVTVKGVSQIGQQVGTLFEVVAPNGKVITVWAAGSLAQGLIAAGNALDKAKNPLGEGVEIALDSTGKVIKVVFTATENLAG
jgi:hypothetical protein